MCGRPGAPVQLMRLTLFLVVDSAAGMSAVMTLPELGAKRFARTVGNVRLRPCHASLIGGGPRSSSGSLATFTVISAPRRASTDLVAERCDAAICPKSGEKRKCAACAENDVDDPEVTSGQRDRLDGDLGTANKNYLPP